MHEEIGSPGSRATRLTVGEAWTAISQQVGAQGRHNPTINTYAHVWAQLGRRDAQSTGARSTDTEAPQDPAVITRLRALGGIR
jgi:hypothetical protein